MYEARAEAISAVRRTQTYAATGERYQSFTINDADIVGIDSIVTSGSDSVERQEWTEVPYLGYNSGGDRRFVTRVSSKGQLSVHFGGGVSGELLLNPEADVKFETFFDPSSFLRTGDYGLAPEANTVLVATYFVGGGVRSNVPAGSISGTIDGISYLNELPSSGGRGPETVDELRQNALASFGAQGRVVTLADYEAKALEVEGVTKAFAKKGAGINVIDLYVLSSDGTGLSKSLSESDINRIKSALEPHIMVTHRLVIKQAFIVTIGVNYEIIVFPEADNRLVLSRCNAVLAAYFDTSKAKINATISLSSVSALLDRVEGVQTVRSIVVKNLTPSDGPENYSSNEYDIAGATREGIVYPSYDPCIFELKNPNIDIRGRIV